VVRSISRGSDAGAGQAAEKRWLLGTLYRTFRGYFAGQVVLALTSALPRLWVFALLAIPLTGVVLLSPWRSGSPPCSLCQRLHDRPGEWPSGSRMIPARVLRLLVAGDHGGCQVGRPDHQPKVWVRSLACSRAWLLVQPADPAPVSAGLLGLGAACLACCLAVAVASCLKTFLD